MTIEERIKRLRQQSSLFSSQDFQHLDAIRAEFDRLNNENISLSTQLLAAEQYITLKEDLIAELTAENKSLRVEIENLKIQTPEEIVRAYKLNEMNCKSCANWKPAKKPEAEMIVTVWFPLLKKPQCKEVIHQSYTISDPSDIPEIIKLLEQGALAVKVECGTSFDIKEEGAKWTSVYMWKAELPKIGIIRHGYYLNKGDNYLFWGADSLYFDHDIEEAIAEHLKQKPAPKSAHKAGEVFDEDWVYAGELRVPKKGDCCEFESIIRHVANDLESVPCEILRPRKPEPAPKFKVGDFVVCLFNGSHKGAVGMVKEIGYSLLVAFKKGDYWYQAVYLRPATPAEIDSFYRHNIDAKLGVPIRPIKKAGE